MACECFKKTGEMLKEHLLQRHAGDIGELDEAGWANSMFVLSEGDHAGVSLPYKFLFYKRRKNGMLEARRTDRSTFLTMKFCPLCGTEFKGTPKKEEPAA